MGRSLVERNQKGRTSMHNTQANGKTVQRDDETLCRAGMRYNVEPYHGLVFNRKPAMKSMGCLVGTTKH